MYTHFTPQIDRIIHDFLMRLHPWHRVVWDLGAGSGCFSAEHLLNLGALGVIAVDKEEMVPPKFGILPIQGYFQDIKLPEEGISVAFLGWPQNRPLHLKRILTQSAYIIYIGSNVNGNACGDPALYEHLTRLEIVEHWSCSENTLTIYSNHVRSTRGMTGEEYAATHPWMLLSYEEAEQRAYETSFDEE